SRHFLVGNQAQQVRNAVEAGTLLVIRSDNIPRRMFGVGRFEHHVAGAGILEPLRARGQIHRAEFPFAPRIGDARLEPAFLLLVADLQPEFDEEDATVHDVLFGYRAQFQETVMLLLVAKAHHVFDTGAVVPTPIEDDDFARCREVRHVTLNVHLRFLAVRWRWQRYQTKDPRADALGDGADSAALSGAIASF